MYKHKCWKRNKTSEADIHTVNQMALLAPAKLCQPMLTWALLW